jgi:hypothetical protein
MIDLTKLFYSDILKENLKSNTNTNAKKE